MRVGLALRRIRGALLPGVAACFERQARAQGERLLQDRNGAFQSSHLHRHVGDLPMVGAIEVGGELERIVDLEHPTLRPLATQADLAARGPERSRGVYVVEWRIIRVHIYFFAHDRVRRASQVDADGGLKGLADPVQVLEIDGPDLLGTEAETGLLSVAAVVVEELVGAGRAEGFAEDDLARSRLVGLENGCSARVPATAGGVITRDQTRASLRPVGVEANARRDADLGQDDVDHAVACTDVHFPSLFQKDARVILGHLIGDRVHLPDAAQRDAQLLHDLHREPLLGADPIAIELVVLDPVSGRVARESRSVEVRVPKQARQAGDARPQLWLQAQLDEPTRITLARARIGDDGLEIPVRNGFLQRRRLRHDAEALVLEVGLGGATFQAIHRGRRSDLAARSVQHVAVARALGEPDTSPESRIRTEAHILTSAQAANAFLGHVHPDLGGRLVRSIARHDVDDTGKCIGAVKHRARSAHDFDAFDVREIGPILVAGVAGAGPAIVHDVVVLQHEDPVAEATEARLPSNAHARISAIVPAENARRSAQRLDYVRIREQAYFLARDDDDRAGSVLNTLRTAGCRSHLARAHEGHVEALGAGLADLQLTLDGLRALMRDSQSMLANRQT